jgi:hypothetical protein
LGRDHQRRLWGQSVQLGLYCLLRQNYQLGRLGQLRLKQRLLGQ